MNVIIISFFLVIFSIFLSPVATEKYMTAYPAALDEIKKIYVSPVRFDEDFVKKEDLLYAELYKVLHELQPKQVVALISFEDPFEAFYLLGYCFAEHKGNRKSLTTSERSQYYQCLFDKCLQDKSFRKGIVRYFAWTKSLCTDFRYKADLQYGLAFFHKYCEDGMLSQDENASERAFFSLIYMELFGCEFAGKLVSFDDDKQNGFYQLNECRSKLVDLVHGVYFEVHHGYLYRPTVTTKSDRTIRISSEKDPKKFAERIPNSISPLFPTEKFSIELQNFLDLHEINCLFCWKI